MTKKRFFLKNKKALSVMHDAVLFVVMISFSSVLLFPALQSDIAVDNSIEKHREELVDETLLMISTSRADDFGYTLAGSQIKDITNIDIDCSGKDLSVVDTLVKTFLGREQKHKTYADLCVENLVCQLEVFGTRVNIFTNDFDESLKEELNEVISKYLGEKYHFHMIARWRPVLGIDFGGDIEIGLSPPDTTHVSKTYLTLPNTFFSEWFDEIDDYIYDTIDNINSWSSDDDGLKLQIKNLTFGIIENLTLYGFNGRPSILDKSIDYVFSPIIEGIGNIFGDSSEMVLDPLETVYSNVRDELLNFFIEAVSNVLGTKVSDSNGDGKLDTDDALFALKEYVAGEVDSILFSVFDGYLESFADYIVDTFDLTTQIALLKQNLINFIKDHINPLRAEIVLTIWEVRG